MDGLLKQFVCDLPLISLTFHVIPICMTNLKKKNKTFPAIETEDGIGKASTHAREMASDVCKKDGRYYVLLAIAQATA